MASSRRMLPPLLLLLFLLMNSEMGTWVVNARTCESQSHKFVGLCVRKANCANVCRTEGFHGGVCHGMLFHRKCYCTKNC
ncbi:Oxygen evolving enhancer protein 3 (PsbQ) [Musa troglodytarum]|uniref:Oxygen evolving enhancer protein 3 (PsbQ) n=1 Tax=Musa troglodytarum TaxID=320322 RepID=A0A9E7F5B5_9LILI|nr:Oxygen evolving enhancer protein 3 (PsbQ) [Musa troglodytarum]